MFDQCLRIKLTHFLVLCILITFFIVFLLAYYPLNKIDEICNCSVHVSEKVIKQKPSYQPQTHRLAVLVPYRNRFEELLEFVPYINNFLNQQNVKHHIFVLNQVDEYRFNRASLINVGYRFVKNEYDYIAMHDVDLLPLNAALNYDYPAEQPFHVASPQLHPKYHYPTFVGGILLINREQFAQVNGMSNKYWGWGLEDDEFYVRLRDANINVSRPMNITTDITNTFKHIHDKNHRKRDMVKCYNQREVTRKRDRQTGLNNVAYEISGVKALVIDTAPTTLLNIHLHCDRNITPWCDCTEHTDKSTKVAAAASGKKKKKV